MSSLGVHTVVVTAKRGIGPRALTVSTRTGARFIEGRNRQRRGGGALRRIIDDQLVTAHPTASRSTTMRRNERRLQARDNGRFASERGLSGSWARNRDSTNLEVFKAIEIRESLLVADPIAMCELLVGLGEVTVLDVTDTGQKLRVRSPNTGDITPAQD